MVKIQMVKIKHVTMKISTITVLDSYFYIWKIIELVVIGAFTGDALSKLSKGKEGKDWIPKLFAVLNSWNRAAITTQLSDCGIIKAFQQ